MDMPMYHNNSNKARQSKQPLVLTALGTLALAFLFWAFYLKPTPVPIVTKVRTFGDLEWVWPHE